MANKVILFIVNVDWFFKSHRLPLASEALNKGYEVHLCCGVTGSNKALEALGIKVHQIPLNRSSVNVLNEFKTLLSIYSVIKTVSPDICHLVSIKPLIYGGLCTRLLNVKKVVSAISGLGFVFSATTLKAKLLRCIVLPLYKLALGGCNNHIVVQNPEDKSIINDFIKSAKVTLIKGSGVDVTKFVQRAVPSNDKLKVLFMARLLKDKGIYEFLAAAKALEGQPFEFVVAGDLDECNPASLNQDELDSLIKKHKENCKFIGYQKDVYSVINACDVVVLPSYREGFPKSLAEAAMAGRPIITTDTAGCRDAVIEGETGFIVPLKQSESIVKALLMLNLDRVLLSRMSENARDFAVSELSLDKVVNQHFEIYNR